MSPLEALAFWSLVGLLSICTWGLLWVLCVARGRASRAEEEIMRREKPTHTTWRTSCSWCEQEYKVERRAYDPDLGETVYNHGMCVSCLDQLRESESIR